jgi:hypothetical protein
MAPYPHQWPLTCPPQTGPLPERDSGGHVTPVGDFELDLDYRITGGNSGNSGIQYRSKDMGDFVVGGYQADFEAGQGFSGILYEERGRGIFTKRGERTTIAADGKKAAGEPIGNAAELQKAIKPGE